MVGRLRYDICTVTFNNTMVPFDHISCKECLGLWLGQGKSCQWCRQSFEAGDVRDTIPWA